MQVMLGDQAVNGRIWLTDQSGKRRDQIFVPNYVWNACFGHEVTGHNMTEYNKKSFHVMFITDIAHKMNNISHVPLETMLAVFHLHIPQFYGCYNILEW